MKKAEFQDLLDKYLNGKCSEAEEQLLAKFYDHFQGDESWPEGLGQKEKFEFDLFKDITRNVERVEREETKETRSSWFQPAVKVAASIIIVASLGVFGWTYFGSAPREIASIEKTTARGQKSTIVLRDGTEVRLNAESKLVFPEEFGATREVHLEGEAFFNVARDVEKPFIIKSRDITTTVLGTSFNVRAFPDEDIEVTVATGKVQVETNSEAGDATPGSKVFLLPNEQINYDLSSRVMEKRKVDIERYLAWKEGIIQFKDTELQDAAKTLERWYGVTIQFSNEEVKKCKIQMGTYKDENLYHILQSFEFILGIKFKVENGDQITISGTGCSPTT